WGLAKLIAPHSTPSALDAQEQTTASKPELPPRQPSLSLASDSGLTEAGAVIGTPSYMSPEQAAGRLEELGPATDIYSLGATLYCLLTGRPPFHGDPIKVLDEVERGAVPPPRQITPAVPRALEAICLKALAREPAQRYPSARDLARDVERWLAGEPVSA